MVLPGAMLETSWLSRLVSEPWHGSLLPSTVQVWAGGATEASGAATMIRWFTDGSRVSAVPASGLAAAPTSQVDLTNPFHGAELSVSALTWPLPSAPRLPTTPNDSGAESKFCVKKIHSPTCTHHHPKISRAQL